jgi:hypothetical protein
MFVEIVMAITDIELRMVAADDHSKRLEKRKRWRLRASRALRDTGQMARDLGIGRALNP